jgi:nitrate reductase alpha subunit
VKTVRSRPAQALNGVIPRRPGGAGGRRCDRHRGQACEAILTLSGTTNGRVAVEGFRNLEERTGQQLADLALDNEGKRITFADTQARRCP